MRYFPFALLSLALLNVPLLANAENADGAPAAATAINNLDNALLATMKDAKALGYQGRFDKLAPVIDKTFDLGLMTKLLVGPQWNNFTPDKQAKLLQQFRRYTIGSYASRFDGYDGEHFELMGAPLAQKSDLRVQTQLVPKTGAPVKLDYIMRDSGKGWRVIDIFLQGTISELATERSQFQSVLSENGVDGLITTLDKKTADLATAPGDGTPVQQQ